MPAGWNTLTGIGDLMNSDDDSYLTIALKGIVVLLKVVMFWDLSAIMEAKHLTKTHMVSAWMCPFGMFESDACSNPLVPCGVCLHAHRGCFDCWSWNQVFLMFFVVASAFRHLPPVKRFFLYPNYPRPSKSRLLEDLTPAIHSNPEVEMILQQRKAPVPKNPRKKRGGICSAIW